MNTDGDAALNKNEFAKFFKSISTRKEIVDLMKRFSSNGAHMTPEDLHFFLVNEQGVSLCNCNGTVDRFFSQTVNQATHSLYQSSLSFNHGQSLTQPVRWSVS